MAIQLDFTINGKQGGTPINAGEIKLISNWNESNLEDKSESEVSTNVLQFALEDANEINGHVSGGLTGGGGIFEGLPYAITANNLITGVKTTILDGYIDLTENANFISCDEVEAVIKKRKNLDWFSEQADSFSFAYLANLPNGTKGKINESDYVAIPYVLNFRPDGFVVVMISTNLFLLGKEIYQTTREIIKTVSDFVEAQPFDLADLAAAILKVIALLIYLALLIKLFYDLVVQMIEEFMPPVRRYKGMTFKTMFIRGCEYLGLDFQSTIFAEQKWTELIYMPTKSVKGKIGGGVFKSPIENGHPNTNSAIYNFGDFLRVMKQMFNAQIKIEGKTLQFERRDYWDSTSTWVLPEVETDQQRRLSTFKYNTGELNSNYIISFSVDPVDENTLETFKGTNFQAITTPVIVGNKDFVNVKGLAEVRLPFALGVRKEGLNRYEVTLITLAVLLDTFVAGVNIIRASLNNLSGGSVGNQNSFALFGLTKSITNRIGILQLSQDLTGVDKMLPDFAKNPKPNLITEIATNLQSWISSVFNVTKPPSVTNAISNQAALSLTTLNASQLWAHFHCINSFAETIDGLKTYQTNTYVKTNNQAKIYEAVEMPFCEEDWLSLQTNNRFVTNDGKIGEVLRIEWDLQNDKAVLDYTVKEKYTNNLKVEFNEGG
jgi:hypothetical protein